MLNFARTYGIIKANVYSASYYVTLSSTFFKKATPTGLNSFSVMQIMQALRCACHFFVVSAQCPREEFPSSFAITN